MDHATLESLISNLEKRSDSLDEALSFWILLVVIGLFLEILVIVVDHISDLKAYRRGTIRSPEKPAITKLLFHLSGATLIAIGVAGELYVHQRSMKVNTDLRSANGQYVVLLEKEAGIARKYAEEARERASKAEQRTVEVLAVVQPRYLSSAQEKEATSGLLRFAGYSLSISSLRYDGEAALLAKQLKSMFNRARIGVDDKSVDRIAALPGISTGALFGGGVEYPSVILTGIEVSSSETSTALAMVRILKSVELSVRVSGNQRDSSPKGRQKFIAVSVGSKPIPDLK